MVGQALSDTEAKVKSVVASMNEYRDLAKEFAFHLLCACRTSFGEIYVCRFCNANITYFPHKEECPAGKAREFLKMEGDMLPNEDPEEVYRVRN